MYSKAMGQYTFVILFLFQICLDVLEVTQYLFNAHVILLTLYPMCKFSSGGAPHTREPFKAYRTPFHTYGLSATAVALPWLFANSVLKMHFAYAGM